MSIHRPTSPIGSLHRRDGAGVVRMEDHFETDSDDLWTRSPHLIVLPGGSRRSTATFGSEVTSRPSSRAAGVDPDGSTPANLGAACC